MKEIFDPLLAFPDGCRVGRLQHRLNRFHVEVALDGLRVGVHCNNSGSMLGLLRKGAPALISPTGNPHRKLRYTLELIQVGGLWVGVNTQTPNRILHQAWKHGTIPEIRGYSRYRAEAVAEHSRLDACLEAPESSLWVEAKNVTLVEDEVAYFPDAVTERGRKHLRELMSLASKGHRAACFYLVQRSDARCFGPADFIDAEFARLFWEALDAGVEAWPYRARVSPQGIGLHTRLDLMPRIRS